MSLKITIQGIEGSFQDAAVQQLFPNMDVTFVPCNSFKKAATLLKQNTVAL
jgi:prephenate dehydratase